MSRRLTVILHAAAMALLLVLTGALASAPEPALLSVDRLEDGYVVLAAADGACFAVPEGIFGLTLAEGQLLMVSAVPDLEARKLREASNGAIVEELSGGLD